MQGDRVSETGFGAEIREAALSVHACFLIKSMSQREEHIRDISINLLNQLSDKFPQVSSLQSIIFALFLRLIFSCSFPLLLKTLLCAQVHLSSCIICLQILWNSSCLDSLLFSVHNDPPSALVNDPAWVATVRSLYQRIVREWIIVSLSYAPCTSQGLLQVCLSVLITGDHHYVRSFTCFRISVLVL